MLISTIAETFVLPFAKLRAEQGTAAPSSLPNGLLKRTFSISRVTDDSVVDLGKRAFISLYRLLEGANISIPTRVDKIPVAACAAVGSNCAESTVIFSKVPLEDRFVEAVGCRHGESGLCNNTARKSVCHCTMIWPVIFG